MDMKAENGRSNSPLHVHVENNTPVHLHVKKKKKKDRGVPTAVEVQHVIFNAFLPRYHLISTKPSDIAQNQVL